MVNDANVNSAGVDHEPLNLDFKDKEEINTEELSYGSHAEDDFTETL